MGLSFFIYVVASGQNFCSVKEIDSPRLEIKLQPTAGAMLCKVLNITLVGEELWGAIEPVNGDYTHWQRNDNFYVFFGIA